MPAVWKIYKSKNGPGGVRRSSQDIHCAKCVRPDRYKIETFTHHNNKTKMMVYMECDRKSIQVKRENYEKLVILKDNLHYRSIDNVIQFLLIEREFRMKKY